MYPIRSVAEKNEFFPAMVAIKWRSSFKYRENCNIANKPTEWQF